MDSTEFHNKHSQRSAALAKVLLVSGVLFAAVHPISCNGFWWQLSRGRAVTEGSLAPAQNLVSGSVHSEADWLGGVPFFLIFDAFGPLGLMVLKIAAAGLVVSMICKRLHGGRLLAASVCTVAAISSRTAWEPTPLLLETVGLVLTLISARRWADSPSIGRFWPLLLIAFAWGNCGPRSLVCVVVAVVEVLRSQTPPLAKATAIAAVAAVCCVTPAGLSTLRNSAVITLPILFEDAVILTSAGMAPWFIDMHRAEQFAFAALTGMALINLLFSGRRACGYVCFGFLIAQVLAVSSTENLPLASVLISIYAFAPPSARLVELTNNRNTWNRFPANAVAVCIAVISCVPGSGAWEACGSGPGWGIDPCIDDEAFAASVKTIRMTESAHCVGIREAGLLAWHVRQGIKPYDTAQTALLNGRLAEHVLLTSDLTIGWRTPHRRPDSNWGGWWNIVRRRNIKMLVVPCENVALVRALEPSIWKPVSLNAVSLIYGKSGDPDCTPQIVRALSLRHLVDREEWQHVIRSGSSRSFFDVADWFCGGLQTYESLRLARVFRAMRLNLAALRVLRVIQKDTDDVVLYEFAKNQIELGYRERLATGRSSRLRLQAYQMAMGSKSVDVESVLNWPHVGGVEDAGLPKTAINEYVNGNADGAIDEMTNGQAEAIYARAMLMLELGQTESASINLRRVVSEFSDHHVAGAAKAAVLSLDRSL